MKKIFESCVLNVVLAFLAALGFMWQEVNIGIAPVAGMIGIGVVAAIGGSMLGEAINTLVGKAVLKWANICFGAVGGLVLAILILCLL